MSDVKFVSMFINHDNEPMVVSMASRDKTTKTYEVYTRSKGWHRITRKEILAMEEVLPSPACTEFMESLVDDGIIFRRWQYQIML